MRGVPQHRVTASGPWSVPHPEMGLEAKPLVAGWQPLRRSPGPEAQFSAHRAQTDNEMGLCLLAGGTGCAPRFCGLSPRIQLEVD